LLHEILQSRRIGPTSGHLESTLDSFKPKPQKMYNVSLDYGLCPKAVDGNDPAAISACVGMGVAGTDSKVASLLSGSEIM
jgi:hypothetical protein